MNFKNFIIPFVLIAFIAGMVIGLAFTTAKTGRLAKQNGDMLIIIANMLEKNSKDIETKCMPQYIFVEKNSGEWESIIFERIERIENGEIQ